MALVLFAVTLVGLLLIAAAVVDYGVLYNDRRQDQNAADSAALAGAQELPDEASAVARVKEYAIRVLDGALRNSDFNRCTVDPGRLEVVAANNNCISFNRAHTRIRVRLPDQSRDTIFAGVAGIDTLTHSAFAIAGVRNVGFGNVLPFGIGAGAGSADGHVCLKSDSSTGFPCDSTSGNFGFVDFGYFGNEDVGTSAVTAANDRCGSGGTSTRVRNNTAVGVDHVLDVAPTAAATTSADAPDACVSGTEIPDNAFTQTGNVDLVEDGLIGSGTFTDGGPSRLRRPNNTVSYFSDLPSGQIKTFTSLDNTPLWEFIPTSLTAGSAQGSRVPTSCQRNQFDNLSNISANTNLPEDVRDHLLAYSAAERGLRLLQRCFAHYQGQPWRDLSDTGIATITNPEPRPTTDCPNAPPGQPCTDPVFIRDTTVEDPNLFDIQFNPRFAYVPQFWTSFPPGSSTPVVFRSFRAVYVIRMLFGTGSNQATWIAGFNPSSVVPTNRGFREVTGMAFHPNMLPNNLGTSSAAFNIGANRFVRLVR